MKVSIKKQKENPLFKRKELSLEIEHEENKTPSKAELQQYMAKEVKKDVENVEIKNIFSDCGMAKSKAKVFVWEEKKVQDLSKVVKKHEKKEAPKEKEEKVTDEGKRDYAVEEKKEAPAEGEAAPAAPETGKEAPAEAAKDEKAEPAKEEKPDKKKK